MSVISRVGSAGAEEVVGSAGGVEDVEFEVGCTVEADFIAVADVAEVIVSLVEVLVLKMCV